MLGKSPRQVRYMLQQNELKAHKADGRWVFKREDLPLSPTQQEARTKKAEALADIVQDALAPHTKPARKRYSVRDMAAFQVGKPQLTELCELLGAQHPAARALEEALILVTQGCHRFEPRDKLDAYRQARSHAAAAVARLLLQEEARCLELGALMEEELLPALAGLVRQSERPRASS